MAIELYQARTDYIRSAKYLQFKHHCRQCKTLCGPGEERDGCDVVGSKNGSGKRWPRRERRAAQSGSERIVRGLLGRKTGKCLWGTYEFR